MNAFAKQEKGRINANTVPAAFFVALLSFPFNAGTAGAQNCAEKSTQSANEGVIVSAAPRTLQASLEMKQTTLSIISFMLEKCPNAKDNVSAKVPTHVYAGVIQELQDRHAGFLPSGAQTPVEARAVFKLKAEETGLEQTVCLY